MALTQAQLNSYRAGVDAYGDAAASYVRQYVAEIRAANPDATVAQIRDTAIEGIEDALNVFGDQAAELALDLFEEAMGTGYDLQISDVIDKDAMDSKVRYYAHDLTQDGGDTTFTRNVTDLTKYYIKRTAYENMVANCWRDHVAWARVPSGRETCSFCYMLSSRGFVYGSERSAAERKDGGAYHRNCDCVAVPGYADLDWDTQIEGYEPNRMYERWKACARTVGEDPDSDDDAARSRIRAEVETRDWRWLYSGDAPAIDTSALSKKQLKRLQREKPLEWEGYVKLSENGVSLKLDDEDRAAAANIDFEWMLGDGTQYWELKTPRKGALALTDLLEEGYSKWERLSAEGAALPEGFNSSNLGSPRLVIDNRYSEMSDDVAEKTILEQMDYLTSHGSLEFPEAILITKNGELSRIKNSGS